MGKLTGSSTQRNLNYSLSTTTDSDVQQGFVDHENFCQMFTFREKLWKVQQEISEKGYTFQNVSLMGNSVFNTTVHFKSSFFERLMKPMIEELNMSDKRIGSKYMNMSLEAQINSLR